jgi:hypothetical protein
VYEAIGASSLVENLVIGRRFWLDAENKGQQLPSKKQIDVEKQLATTPDLVRLKGWLPGARSAVSHWIGTVTTRRRSVFVPHVLP